MIITFNNVFISLYDAVDCRWFTIKERDIINHELPERVSVYQQKAIWGNSGTFIMYIWAYEFFSNFEEEKKDYLY